MHEMYNLNSQTDQSEARDCANLTVTKITSASENQWESCISKKAELWLVHYDQGWLRHLRRYHHAWFSFTIIFYVCLFLWLEGVLLAMCVVYCNAHSAWKTTNECKPRGMLVKNININLFARVCTLKIYIEWETHPTQGALWKYACSRFTMHRNTHNALQTINENQQRGIIG